MTVKELIRELQKIADKDLPISLFISYEIGRVTPYGIEDVEFRHQHYVDLKWEVDVYHSLVSAIEGTH